MRSEMIQNACLEYCIIEALHVTLALERQGGFMIIAIAPVQLERKLLKRFVNYTNSKNSRM